MPTAKHQLVECIQRHKDAAERLVLKQTARAGLFSQPARLIIRALFVDHKFNDAGFIEVVNAITKLERLSS